MIQEDQRIFLLEQTEKRMVPKLLVKREHIIQLYQHTVIFLAHIYISEKKNESVSHSIMSDSSRPHGLQATRLLHPWDFQGKSTGVGCHCLLRGYFPNNSYLLSRLESHSRKECSSPWWVIQVAFCRGTEALHT